MNASITPTPADEVCSGDIVELPNGLRKEVEDLRDDSRKGGVWVDFTDHSTWFYGFTETVKVVRQED